MPRTLSTDFIGEIESPYTGEQFIDLAVISHPSLEDPIRVANDIVNYVYDGNTYVGFPFELERLPDNERPPRGKIRIQNVDRRIGEIVLKLRNPPMMTITGLTGSDFGDPVDVSGVKTRSPIGTPGIEYQAIRLELRNIRGDVNAIEAEYFAWEPTSEPWPNLRATKDNLPGLYR